MAKTFDREWESQKSTFLYQKARQTQTWIEYPPMPPPFNLVPIAFYTVVALSLHLSGWPNALVAHAPNAPAICQITLSRKRSRLVTPNCH